MSCKVCTEPDQRPIMDKLCFFTNLTETKDNVLPLSDSVRDCTFLLSIIFTVAIQLCNTNGFWSHSSLKCSLHFVLRIWLEDPSANDNKECINRRSLSLKIFKSGFFLVFKLSLFSYEIWLSVGLGGVFLFLLLDFLFAPFVESQI